MIQKSEAKSTWWNKAALCVRQAHAVYVALAGLKLIIFLFEPLIAGIADVSHRAQLRSKTLYLTAAAKQRERTGEFSAAFKDMASSDPSSCQRFLFPVAPGVGDQPMDLWRMSYCNKLEQNCDRHAVKKQKGCQSRAESN